MNNKRLGTEFERAFADILAEHRFWVHIFQDNKNGQPCDVVAARDGYTYLIDCKNCESAYFLLNRMEENQYNAMELFKQLGNEDGWFAVQFLSGGIYMIPYWKIRMLQEHGVKRLSEKECCIHGVSFSRWIWDVACHHVPCLARARMMDRRDFKYWLGKCEKGKLCRLS